MLGLLAQESREHLGIPLTPAQLESMEAYASLLVEWSARINLTAVRDPAGIRVRHFLDSLSCLQMIPGDARRLIDVGTGAGFPGLVLKIVRPEMALTLVESVGKKADFCRRVAETLALQDVQVLRERAESLGQSPAHRSAYDAAVARGVAALPVLAEYLLPLVRVGGIMLAQKGAGGLEEAAEAEAAVEILGGGTASHRSVRLPGVSEPHLLIAYKKIRPTPEKYPRRVGIPSKRPLSSKNL